MITSNQFMSLKMFGGPPVRVSWCVCFIGFCTVIGMLVAMIVVGVVGKVFGAAVSRSQHRGGES